MKRREYKVSNEQEIMAESCTMESGPSWPTTVTFIKFVHKPTIASSLRAHPKQLVRKRPINATSLEDKVGPTRDRRAVFCPEFTLQNLPREIIAFIATRFIWFFCSYSKMSAPIWSREIASQEVGTPTRIQLGKRDGIEVKSESDTWPWVLARGAVLPFEDSHTALLWFPPQGLRLLNYPS